MFNKLGLIVVAASVALAGCNQGYDPNVQQTAAACVQGDPNCAGQVVQQGGSFIQEHPIATAAIVGAGAYALGKRNERRNYGGGGYYYPQRRVVRRTVYRSVAPTRVITRTYSAPRSYRTVTRTVRYRR